MIGGTIAFYHLGIEQGFFNESVVCETQNINGNLSKVVLPLLAEFNEEDSKYWFPKNEIFNVCKNPEILPMLYEIKLLEKIEDKIFINERFTEKIQRLTIGFPKGKISQKQIDDSLKIMKNGCQGSLSLTPLPLKKLSYIRMHLKMNTKKRRL